ncbi:hypothetical protein KJ865_16055 [Myxococcota bacterium]|nr:hypothetical protein [Myxococcota bacterium]
MKPALPTDVPQKGPAKNGKPPKGTLTAQFAHHKRRNMIRTFSSSVDNESRVTVKMYADGSVTLDDKGKWLDRVTYSKLTACQSRVEEKRWDTLYEGTWEQNGKQLVIKTKLVNEKCTQGVTCDSRPPEMTPCGPVTKTLILTCTADSLTLKQDKKSIPAWKCDMGKAATHTSNPWNFGRDQCVERYMGNRWPFYYRPCAAQKPN